MLPQLWVSSAAPVGSTKHHQLLNKAQRVKCCVSIHILCMLNGCHNCCCSLNRLVELPRGFGTAPSLAILDLTYNNLSDDSFPGNFSYLGGITIYGWYMCYHLCVPSGTLRALYMGDNDLNGFPPSIEKFELLQVVNWWYEEYMLLCTLTIAINDIIYISYSWSLEIITSLMYQLKYRNVQTWKLYICSLIKSTLFHLNLVCCLDVH